MSALNAEQRRFQQNARLIAAMRLIFSKLVTLGVPERLLSDIAHTASGGTPSRQHSTYFGGNIPWIKSGDLTDGLISKVDECISEEGLENSAAQVFPKGTVVIALYGATVGKTGILAFPAASNQAVCSVIPKDRSVRSRFLFWLLRNKRYDFLQQRFGGAQPNISQTMLRSVRLPIPDENTQDAVIRFLEAVELRQQGVSTELPDLPPPLAEQRRLVERIDVLAAKIEEARRLRGEGDEETTELGKQSIASVFDAVAGFHKPEPLGDHVKVEGGFAFKSGEYQDSGLPIIRIANLVDESVNMIGSPCMPEDRLSEFRRFVLRGGDILIAMTGATTGKLGIVPENCHNWLLNQRVGRFAPKSPDQLDLKYVYWLARGVQQVIFETAYGGAQPNISPRDIEGMQFPFPPIEHQRSIVARLDAMEAKLRSAQQLQFDSAAELAALLPAILDRAFRGELL